MKSVFISGISSGIGKGIALNLANKDITVYGISRKTLDYEHPNIKHLICDINDERQINKELRSFIKDIKLDMAILNAGILGKVEVLNKTSLSELKTTMDTNLWAQKTLIDLFLNLNNTKTIIGISSGAAIRGSKGWGGYSLSKAAFNMLIQLYASENPAVKFIAFAPGLVDTNMQAFISSQVESSEFPNFKRLHDARGTDSMPNIEKFGELFYEKLDRILETQSGDYIDLRNLD